MNFIEACHCVAVSGGRSDGGSTGIGVEIPTHFPTPTCPVFRPPPES